MDKSAVIAKLREHEPELKAAGVIRLSLFGSVARGDASAQSDIDLLAEFDSGREFSLLERVRLENRLTDLLERFTLGMDFAAFIEDPKTVSAVERKLQIISEAAIRLGPEAEERVPGVAWRDVRGIGNWLRHQYDRVELPVLWKTIADDLPQLRVAVLRALHR
jgi:uncharacterized protein with HEPN domain